MLLVNHLQILPWATLVSERAPFLWEKKVDSVSGSQPEQEAKGLDGAAKAFELPSEASFKDLDSFVVTTLISAYFLGLLQFLLLD